jgi:hypothetical protein
MEFIHPPIGYIQRKEQEKSPYVGRRLAEAISLRPGLDHPVFPPTRFTSMFSVETSFQADCGLNPSYIAIFKITLEIDINFEMGCIDRMEENEFLFLKCNPCKNNNVLFFRLYFEMIFVEEMRNVYTCFR